MRRYSYEVRYWGGGICPLVCATAYNWERSVTSLKFCLSVVRTLLVTCTNCFLNEVHFWGSGYSCRDVCSWILKTALTAFTSLVWCLMFFFPPGDSLRGPGPSVASQSQVDSKGPQNHPTYVPVLTLVRTNEHQWLPGFHVFYPIL